MSYRDIASTHLRVDEGERSKPYRDTVGKLSIGIGRNLDDVGLHPDEIEFLFQNDLNDAERRARALVPSFEDLSDNRKAVLVDMAFNLQARLGGFVEMLRHVHERHFDFAAEAMLDSLWAHQVGERAQRLAKIMREG